MSLPSVDFELVYWRIRRRFQRIRWTLHAKGITARAQAHLEYLCLFGKTPDKPEPEDTFAFRALWVLSIGMVVIVLLFGRDVEPTMPEAATVLRHARPVLPEWSADTEMLKPASPCHA